MTSASAVVAAIEVTYEANKGLYLGPMIVGSWFDFLLCGIMLHQLCQWCAWSGDERKFIKIIVHWSTLWAFAMTCMTLAWIMDRYVYHFGDYSTFVKLDWVAWCHILDVGAIVGVQVFYLDRAYKLHHHSILVPLAVLPFMFAQVGGVVAAKIIQATMDNEAQFSEMSQGMMHCYYAWLGATVVADLLLTSLILWGLWKSRTGFTETNKIVNRLIRVSVETQLPGTIIAIAFIICECVPRFSPMAMFFMLWHPKCYVVTLLAVLNFRFSLRKDLSSLVAASEKRDSGVIGLRSTNRGRILEQEEQPPQKYWEILDDRERVEAQRIAVRTNV